MKKKKKKNIYHIHVHVFYGIFFFTHVTSSLLNLNTKMRNTVLTIFTLNIATEMWATRPHAYQMFLKELFDHYLKTKSTCSNFRTKTNSSIFLVRIFMINTLSFSISHFEGWAQDWRKSDGCFSPNLISSPWRCYEDYNISFCKQWKFRCHCSYEQWHLNLHCLQRGPSCP